jgi:hypothetical protein
MIVHRQVAFGMLAITFLAVAVYCYVGYNLAASFALAAPDDDTAGAVRRYVAGIAAGLLGATVAGVLAWRADPGGRR